MHSKFYRYDTEMKKHMDIVMRFLQQLYVTVLKANGMPTVGSCLQEIFKYKQSTNGQLYYVRCDIKDAFGSINQGIICHIILHI